MRKLVFILSLFSLTALAKTASAQAPTMYTGIEMWAPSGIQIDFVNLDITSSQQLTPGQPPATADNNLSGNYNYPGGTGSILMGLLYYWDNPSIFNPLNFTFGSNSYATVTNTDIKSHVVWITFISNNNNGAPDNETAGAHVTIGAGQTATVPFPVVGGQRFTSTTALGAVDPFGLGFPVTVPFQLGFQLV